MLKLVALEADRFDFLKNSDKLTDNEKQRYGALIRMQDGKYTMDEDTLESALQTLSELLYRHYGQKVIILIDEYDVPLDKAYQNGYYREMVSMIRSLFGEALKTNEFLQFAVLTGCLRVSKESIFTGLNNFKIFSITDARFDEQFGFTEDEVEKMLKDYRLEAYLSEMKEWYDGYHLDKACERAIKQIRDRRYSEYLKNDGRHNMTLYGIAFYKKRCKVVVEKLKKV